MASSFVEYKKYGFWSPDGLLQIWLYFLTQKIDAHKDNAVWLNEVSKEWAIQAQGVCSGCIYVGLDEYITTPKQKQTLINLSNEVIETLPTNGRFLSKEELNRPELGAGAGTTWTVDVPISELVDLGNQFVKLLRGELQSTAASPAAFDSIKTTQRFLQEHCADAEDINELVNHLEMQALANARPLVQGLKDIEYLLAHPPPGDLFLELVMQDAHIQLENRSNESAREWLYWLAKQIRSELHENILPFQPMRAKLVRIMDPDNKRFPHDLLLYPTDEPWPEYWFEKWSKRNIFYDAFIKEWDGETCPTCNAATIKVYYRKKFVREWVTTPLNSTLYYDKLAVYECTNCNCGWTEHYDSIHHTEIEYPG